MIQTRYFCDLCKTELQVPENRTRIEANVIVDLSNEANPREYHVCEECIHNLNIFEVLAELMNQIVTLPGFSKPDPQYMKVLVTTPKRIPSVAEK